MADTLTPMMQQYQRLRGSVPADTLLLFRLGDFYELFFEDAKEASALLNVALTKRNEVPMCGVPYHAAPNYIAKLIKAGRRVAICVRNNFRRSKVRSRTPITHSFRSMRASHCASISKLDRSTASAARKCRRRSRRQARSFII